jgi:hypothetical protein
MNQDKENRWFKEVLEQAEQLIPDPGFEEQVLSQIKQEDKVLCSISRYKKIAWLMLATGIVVGLLIPIVITMLGQAKSGQGQDHFTFPIDLSVLAGIVIVFAILLRELWPAKAGKLYLPRKTRIIR